MAASTPSMCLRSESDDVHSQTSAQASSRLGALPDDLVSAIPAGYPRREPKLGLMAPGTLARPVGERPATDPRMEKFIIEGGAPLSGTVTPAGNKNAALPALAACILTDREVVLRNVPRIRDVEAMIELLVRLGVKAEWREENVVAVRADEVTGTAVD